MLVFTGTAVEMPAAAAKPTAIDGPVTEALQVVWSTPVPGITVGVWEVSTGRFLAARVDDHEVGFVQSGRAVVRSDAGEEMTLTKGDTFVLEHGWTGTWEVLEPFRMVFVSTLVAGPGAS